jgi:hypothetical protein
MAKKKRPLGFQTPSTRIQEECGEILEQLKKKEVNWGEILKDAFDGADNYFEGTKDFVKRTESKELTLEERMELAHIALGGGQHVIEILVAAIGRELAECDIRIAAVEKKLEDLRRGIK